MYISLFVLACVLVNRASGQVATGNSWGPISKAMEDHIQGRNCSEITRESNAIRLASTVGCHGMQLSYIAATLSAVSYLDFAAGMDSNVTAPAAVKFMMTRCPIVRTSSDSLSPRFDIQSAGGTSIFSAFINGIRPRVILSGIVVAFVKLWRQVFHLIMPNSLRSFIEVALQTAFSSLRAIVSGAVQAALGQRGAYISRRARHRAVEEEEVNIRWFFSDWSQGGRWHDTEVLIAENNDHLFIIFRGTDSMADVITNAQTYITASTADFLGKVSEGSLHRGILGAYRAVDSGFLVSVSPSLEPSLHPVASLYDACRGASNATTATDGVCEVSNQSLRDLLISVIHKAIGGPKKLVVSGHSLGGALGTLLCMDVLTSKDFTDFETDWLLRNLRLITFGSPDFADASFYVDIIKNYPHFDSFLRNNDFQYVGVSKAPMCKPDLVSTALDLANGLFGDVFMGRGGGVWGRMRLRSQMREKLQMNSQRSSDKSSSNTTYADAAPSSTELHRPPPLYLSSGRASSVLSGHSMAHYMQGLVWAMNDKRGENSKCDPAGMYEIFGLDRLFIEQSNQGHLPALPCLIASDLSSDITATQMLDEQGAGTECYKRDPNGVFYMYIC